MWTITYEIIILFNDYYAMLLSCRSYRGVYGCTSTSVSEIRLVWLGLGARCTSSSKCVFASVREQFGPCMLN